MKDFLHVGCGGKRKEQTTPFFNTDDWRETRLDIDPSVRPDIVNSIFSMYSVQDNSFDAIFSSHNIEHLDYHNVSLAFNEFSRVLKDNGFAVITCPNLQEICSIVSKGNLLNSIYISPSGPIAPIDVIFGHRPSIQSGKSYMAHRTGFTRLSLQNDLLENGFNCVKVVERIGKFDLWAFAFKKSISEEQMDSFIGENIGH